MKNLRINKKKLQELGKKILLTATTASVIFTSGLFKEEAHAESYDMPDGGMYELSDDNDYLYAEGISNLSMINGLNSLEEVHICDSNLENCDLSDSSIKKLTIEGTTITGELKVPKTLEEIDVENIKLAPDTLSDVEKITITGYKIDDLNEFNFPSCNDFTIQSCTIPSLSGIENMKGLESLNIYNTLIRSIDGIQSLSKLKMFECDYTDIHDITPLCDTPISYIYLSNSPIDTIEPVKNMPNLETFYTNNIEMSYDASTIDYLNKKGIDTYADYTGLGYKKQIEEIAASITNDTMSDREKIKAVTEYVIDNMEYDYRVYTDDDLNASYGSDSLKYALRDKKGSCMVYTVFTSALLRASGVKAMEQRSDNHIWNICIIEEGGEEQCFLLDSTMLDDLYVPIDEGYYYLQKVDPNKAFDEIHDPTSLPAAIIAPEKNNGYDVQTVKSTTTISDSNEIKQEEEGKKQIPLAVTVGLAVALGAAIPLGVKKRKKVALEDEKESNPVIK